MSKRTYSSSELAAICVKLGWQFDRQSGSHMSFVKPGQPRPIVIPAGRAAVAPFIVSNLCRQLGIKKKDLEDLI
ncbi:MAG TPA: type II toxin-antitoxin system HicA family toxin [Thermoanaerobaculia bacterium]|nr:type II toxin-antitoxin system HicA family toxin [Thermoanaerobaculia bacterium]